MTLEEIFDGHPILLNWMRKSLDLPGPWQVKLDIKSKVNCFLNYHLSGKGYEALDIRCYLTNNESDFTWLRTMRLYVIPFILENVSELTHG